ncbi:uncharacterized protein LOC133184985 [Saccostrea echinata]|uniref:uncharacterized protein LOC133184985 n=1 Tax=Saccostrea echinata TaxID=191078 RepID=UPI002A833DE7|nr:uncharacterized protein LOC133184985 [Saccostrea echinata]
MRTTVNLTKRADTGMINTSPTSAMPAIVRLQYGCDHNITIPVFDKDNDVIKCRWAKSSLRECGGVCSSFPHSWLYEKCEIRYSAVYKIGWYAVAIQIEDFASENSTTPLSSIPLQFLIKVFQSSKKCKNKPVFLPPTRANGACVGVSYHSTWSEKIIAKAGENGSISEINTVSPTGVKKSNLSRYDNSGHEWYVNVTWSPRANQAGEHPFCYTASDTDGLVSDRICIELLVGGDVTPPVISVCSCNPNVTNGDITIKYEFNEDVTVNCTLQTLTNFSNVYCTNSSWTGLSLSDGVYTLIVQGTDTENNAAYPKSISWTIGNYKFNVDYQPPSIGPLKDRTINCTQEINIQRTVGPSVEDKSGVKDLTYIDQMIPSCKINRTWIVVDNAGNRNSRSQIFTINSVLPPTVSFPPDAVVACGSLTQITEDVLIPSINYTHPCGLNMSITYKDPDLAANACGFTFYRNWSVSDSCKFRVESHQKIKIQKAQDPITPIRGNITDLQPIFSWTQNLKTTRYQLYVWLTNEKRPSSPKYTGFQNWFKSNKLKPASKYYWQVDFLSYDNVTEYSPRWNFETKAYPDLTVILLAGPPIAHSGEHMDITWTVQNVAQGKIASSWYDEILIGFSTEKANARRVGRFFQNQILSKNDTYHGRAKVSLRDDEIGQAYIFISVDVYNYIPDLDRRNNFKRSEQPTLVQLTPPPDLVVKRVNLQPSTFSGERIQIIFTVSNNGVGVTKATRWTDSIYWSTDENLDNKDLQLFSTSRQGRLFPGQHYSTTAHVSVPRDIYGVFHIIVETDLYSDVFEYLSKENNWLASNNLTVTLTPPPDLSVINLSIHPSSNLSTGDVAEVKWIVKNIGQRTPYINSWLDELALEKNGSKKILGRFHIFRTLPPNENYTYATRFTVDSKTDSGWYNVSLHTDMGSNIFELETRTNNIKMAPIFIRQALPDLQVDEMTTNLTMDNLGYNLLNVSWTVRNIGKGPTINNFWTDTIFLNEKNSNGFYSRRILLNTAIRIPHLQCNSTYTENVMIKLSDRLYGIKNISINVDNFQVLYGDNLSNNVATHEVSIPLRSPNLRIISMTLLNGTLYSGRTGEISWTVVNTGLPIPEEKFWRDSLTLHADTEIPGPNLPKITSYIKGPLQNRGFYTRIARIIIPKNFLGYLSAQIMINNHWDLFEGNSKEDNSMTISITVLSPPSPDLVVTKINSYLLQGTRTAYVSWTVKNTGNSMSTTIQWVDAVGVKLSDENKTLILSKFNQSLQLESGAQYTLNQTILIPSAIIGELQFYVVIDVEENIEEINGEANNWKEDNHRYTFSGIPKANLIATIISTESCSIEDDDYVCISYNVSNNGGQSTEKSSWYDAIFVSINHNSNESLQQNLHNIALHTHIGELAPLDVYTVNTTVTVPKDFEGNETFFYVYPDYEIQTLSENQTSVIKKAISSVEHVFYVPPRKACANLNVQILSRLKPQIGGEPMGILLNITNNGTCDINRIFFIAIYLSKDVNYDMFERKIKTLKVNKPIYANSTITTETKIDLPFIHETQDYSLVMQVDSRSEIIEIDEDDNIAITFLIIQKNLRTDIAVSDVSAPAEVDYGKNVTLSWSVFNDGAETARGYKCDNVYFSQDQQWDISDYQFGETQCKSFVIESNKNISHGMLNTYTAHLPPLAARSYRTIVKVRTNLEDYDPKNNIAVSINSTKIKFPLCALGENLTFNIAPGEAMVIRIPDVPADRSLLVKTRSHTSVIFHEIFIKLGSAPSEYDFDSTVIDPFLTNQEISIQNTREGDYYILVKSHESDLRNVFTLITLEAKIAKFEILKVYPKYVASLGNVTLKIYGTLFPEDFTAFLYNETFKIQCHKQYWFSSSMVAATFDSRTLRINSSYRLNLTDGESKQATLLPIALTVVKGIPGKVVTKISVPGPLRDDEIGEIKLDFENVGQTDATSQIFRIRAKGDGQLMLVNKKQSNRWTNSITVIGGSSDGPGGILSPSETGRLSIKVKCESRRVQITLAKILESDGSKHSYLNMRNNLKPKYYEESDWDRVWENFIQLLGKSWFSLQSKVSEIRNEMSLVEQRQLSFNEIMQRIIEIADGVGEKRYMAEFSDFANVGSFGETLLDIVRAYPRRIGLRGVDGAFGIGWIASIWECYLEGMDEVVALLNWKREEIVFTADTYGIYTNEDKGNLTMISGDLVSFLDTTTGDVFNFNVTTGNVSSIVKQNIKINLVYDNKQTLKSIAYGGNTLDFIYNDNLKIVAINKRELSGNFATCMYSYTEENLLSTVNCGRHVTSYLYNEIGHLIRITESSGLLHVIRYSSDGRLNAVDKYVNDRLISRVVYKDYLNGKIDVWTMPQNITESYWITTHGHIAGFKKSFFPIRKFQRQKDIEEIIEGDLVIERRISFGDFHEIQDGNGNSVFFQEDENGNIATYADANLNTYYILRSLRGYVFMIMYPDNSNETFIYSNNSLVHKDQSGRKMAYHFDDTEKLTFRYSEDKGFLHFQYNEIGRIMSVQNQDTSTSLSYDESGRITELRSEEDTIHQTYDSQNLLKSLRISGAPYDIDYLYNDYGQIMYVTNRADDQMLIRMTYDANGMIKQKTLGNNAKTIFTYYETTRLLKTLSNYYPNGSISSKFQYSYDQKGRLSAMSTVQGIWSFSYDLTGQLVYIKNPMNSTTTIVYDQCKNRVTVSQNGKKHNYQRNVLNQYISIDGLDTEYDRKGNLIKKGNFSLDFNDDNRLSNFTTLSNNCTLHYNGFGHIRGKVCRNNVEIYLTDSFGRILKQRYSQTGSTEYHIYESEVGLVATKRDREYYYYQYDAFGSVVEILDHQGHTINTFSYDAFGNVAYNQNKYVSEFLYLGQWGTISISELSGIYLIGDNLYDSHIGRFLNMDKKGIFCHKPNLYMFKGNNPLRMANGIEDDKTCHMNDPYLHLIYTSTKVDGSTYTLNTYSKTHSKNINGGKSVKTMQRRQIRSVSTFVTHRISNINKGNGLKDIFYNTFDIKDRLKDKSLCQQYIADTALTDGLHFLEDKIFKSSPIGRALDIATFAYKHRDCIFSPCDCLDNARQSLHNSYNDAKMKINSFITDDRARESAMTNYCNGWKQTCIRQFIPINCGKVSHFLSDQFSHFKDEFKSISDNVIPFFNSMETGIEDAASVASDACHAFANIGEGFIRWINSHDPNNLIGPTGYGAARFILKNTDMVYKIQFENDANATAPAQRVYIEMNLDKNLNPRTFRLGTFGFGSFQTEFNFRQSVIQEKINMTEELGVFVAIRGGLDIVNKKASWELQAINASTGLPPSDPSVGFLPPNNGTTGQGFVTFSIRPSTDVKSLDKITAKAVIIFDQNEPIDTPEIFNTIDDTAPYIKNLTIDKDVLDSGSLVLNMDAKDDESGLDYVNIMLQSESGYISLLDDVKEQAVLVPFEPGHNHTFIVLPIDRIGNLPNLELAGSKYSYTVYIPKPEVRCDDVNNCSGNGQCLKINYCLCTNGFYGTDCSRTTPPLDPPILDVFVGKQKNISVPLHLMSSTISSDKDAHMIIKCSGFPDHSYFSAGSVIRNTLYLAAGDFGDVMYIPPNNYNNSFTLDITALVFIESTSEFIEKKTSRTIEINEVVSDDERQQYIRTYLRTTKPPPTSTIEMFTRIMSSSTTALLNFPSRNPSEILPKSTVPKSTLTSPAISSIKPNMSSSILSSTTTESSNKSVVEVTADSHTSAVKQAVIAGIASSLGVLLIITVLTVFLCGRRKNKDDRPHQEMRRTRQMVQEFDNSAIEDSNEETVMW